jgi:hypothetical protein
MTTRLEYRTIGEFPLAWRWTDPQHHLLPPAVLAEIRPLTEASAETVAAEAVDRCREAPVSEFAETWSAEWDDPDSVRKLLQLLAIPRSARVVVSWDRRTAVETSWSVFYRFWSAFCYPSSDDVSVWSPGAEWAVCYRHFGVMQVRMVSLSKRDDG